MSKCLFDGIIITTCVHQTRFGQKNNMKWHGYVSNCSQIRIVFILIYFFKFYYLKAIDGILFYSILFYYFILFYFIFWLHCTACRILVPWPGIKPVPYALEVQSLNHWTAREVPRIVLNVCKFYIERRVEMESSLPGICVFLCSSYTCSTLSTGFTSYTYGKVCGKIIAKRVPHYWSCTETSIVKEKKNYT